jgi:hypothetical protein
VLSGAGGAVRPTVLRGVRGFRGLRVVEGRMVAHVDVSDMGDSE